MATQTGKGHYKGSINDRYQIQNPDGSWSKFDTEGRHIATKVTPGPYKNVRKLERHPQRPR